MALIQKYGQQFMSNAELRRFEQFKCCCKCKQRIKQGQSILWLKENNGSPQHNNCPEITK